MMKRSGVAVLSLVVFSLLPDISYAQTTGSPRGLPGEELWQHGSFYIGGGASWHSRGLPKFDASTNLQPGVGAATGPIGSINTRLDNLFGPEWHFGYKFSEGTVPAWLGRNFRIEGFGWWIPPNRNATEAQSFTNPVAPGASNTYRFPGVGGVQIRTVTFTFINAGATPFILNDAMNLTTGFEEWRGGLRLASDFGLREDWVLTWSIAAIGGRTETRYTSIQTVGALAGEQYALAAKIPWTDVGGSLALRSVYRPTPMLAFFVAGHIDLVHRHASLSASDVYTIGTTVIGSSSVSASANRFDFIGGGEIGAALGEGWWLLTVAGGIDYDNRVPGFRAPTTQAVALTNCPCSPAGIKFSGEVNYHVAVRATFKLW